MPGKPKNHQITLYLTEPLATELDRIAEKLEISRAEAGRQAIYCFLEAQNEIDPSTLKYRIASASA